MNKTLFFGLVLFLGLSINCFSQESAAFPLWDKIPGVIKNETYKEELRLDAQGNRTGVRKVSEPTLIPFLVENKSSKNAAVIICPGGGYALLSIDKEGINVAKWFNSIGVSAFVLKYRLPSDDIMTDKTVGPLQDAQEAIRTLRRNADIWNLDANKIGIMGFSAGGHLASTASTHYLDKVYDAKGDLSARPDFSMLIYPVISMEKGITHNGSKESLLGKMASDDLIAKYSNEKLVDEKTPPTFLVHATDDGAVPVENSINYYLALKKNKVPAEMHLYQNGGHGFGLGTKGTHTDWPKACEHWLAANKIIADKSSVYIFSYFKGNGEDGLHLAYSEDGYKWQSLKKDASFLTPEVGKDKLMRDPCVIKGGDGLYHMVWTVSWTDKGIGYASSKDLIHWSKQEFLPVMEYESGTRNTWAPEITYDTKKKMYMIYWASTIEGKFTETQSTEEKGYNHRIYYTTTKDFKKFTRTKLLYEPGFNVIDATILKEDKGYIMFLKDETKVSVQKNLKVAYSDKLTGSYTKASEPITGDYWAEGPTAIKIDGQWLVYFDKYRDHKYGAIKQTANGWEDVSDKVSFPQGTRHGTVLEVSKSTLLQLMKE
ncbi:beta-galactosidase [Flavobacterium sufflavum]|uniref:Beta-galactosidase n=1 Tax=Flavobacterium sufflavum TaxID=1921138 RepID=A0A437L2N6_9FLAO|nr:prolyl oligopeptidase family serine peptidase [Flavobacterium sufflavum]RVT79575.1 beta-galactosidase [Flavobacterium sufflavum]